MNARLSPLKASDPNSMRSMTCILLEAALSNPTSSNGNGTGDRSGFCASWTFQCRQSCWRSEEGANSADYLRWQLERAGMEVVMLKHDELGRVGHSLKARLGRKLLAPLRLRPIWRDALVAAARKRDAGSNAP